MSTTDMTRGLYRRIYAGYITGRRICALSLPAEAWFWRIHAVADDFGNAHGDPVLLRNTTVGRRSEVTVEDVEGWLGEMERAGLIHVYEVDGERFLHIDQFEDRQPNGKNGKRLKKHPTEEEGIRVNPGESGLIQGNPDSSSASHTHSHSHPHDHSQDQSQPPTEVAPKSTTSKPPKVVDASPILLTFPCRGEPKTWDLRQAQVDHWTPLYPGIDILAECRKALGWVETNQTKTAKKMPAFLTGWFGRAKPSAQPNHGGRRNHPAGQFSDDVDLSAVAVEHRNPTPEELAEITGRPAEEFRGRYTD